MAVCIGGVALSRNPVSTNESFIISVTVKNHQYLKKYRHSDLKKYTHTSRYVRWAVTERRNTVN